VPCIAWQPGTVRAGIRSDAIAMGIDVLPTLCAMAGAPLPAGGTIDGKDITAVLTRNAPSPHDELVLFSEADIAGIRTQNWKYVVADWYAGVQNGLEKRGYPQLYDIRADPGESYSVASLHPDVLKAMQARLARARETFTPLRPGKSRITPAAPTRMPGIIQD
jgi:arylsulfatase A